MRISWGENEPASTLPKGLYLSNSEKRGKRAILTDSQSQMRGNEASVTGGMKTRERNADASCTDDRGNARFPDVSFEGAGGPIVTNLVRAGGRAKKKRRYMPDKDSY